MDALTIASVDRELERIIAAADGTLAEARSRLAALGPQRVAAVVLEEIAWRCRLGDGPVVPTDVHIELIAGQEKIECTATVGGLQPPACRAGASEDAPVRLRQELAELARAVFGPDGGHDATREVWIMNEPGPETDSPDDPWLIELRDATLAAGQLVDACSFRAPSIGTLARRFGSDKWGDHFYTAHYERHLARYRDQRVRVLEIGVGGFDDPELGGESLQMWKAYFRRGLVVGADIFDKSPLDGPRLRTVVADQSDPVALREVSSALGPFDVIIDDGSHLSDHVITSFETLFPLLSDGGLYVIEDLQTAYWPGWNGGRKDRDDPGTATGFLKTLVDALHHQDQMPDAPPVQPAPVSRHLNGIHLYHNIAFLEKGVNAEQTAPSWVRRHESDLDLEPKGSMRRLDTGKAWRAR